MVEDLFDQLLEISLNIQMLKNSIHTLDLAAQKAWVSKTEKMRLKSLQAELLNNTTQADDLWQGLVAEKPLELQKLLLDLAKQLNHVWDKFRSSTPVPDSPQGEYNSRIIPLLIEDLKLMSDGKNPSHDRYWVLAVAQKLILEQKS